MDQHEPEDILSSARCLGYVSGAALVVLLAVIAWLSIE